jgi:predicted membrane metal-binding protein
MATGLSAGAFCGITANELSVSSFEDAGFFENLGAALEETIETIHFRDSQTTSFIKAIITGERSGLNQEVTEIFRSSGASHILALSGLHLGVIYMTISRLLSLIGFGPSASRIRCASWQAAKRAAVTISS